MFRNQHHEVDRIKTDDSQITSNNIQGHLKIKHQQTGYRRKTVMKNQSTASLVPIEESLIHTRNKKITW